MNLKQLMDAKIIKVNEPLQAQYGNSTILASISDSGKVTINNQEFDDPNEAMRAIIGDKPSTSSGLQFWTWWNEDRQAWTPLEHARAELASRSQNLIIKTSESHPLRIDFVTPKGGKGRVGMTICPGKQGSGLYGGQWQRDLKTDLQQIQHWGSNSLISLVESHEFELLGIPEFMETLQQSELNWFHLPIKDMSPPDHSFEKNWEQVSGPIFNQLKQGKDIVIHCRGGLGRTGLLAARILVEQGETPSEAIQQVRSARENAIETFAQEEYILSQAWLP
ncbi:hypothetical protein GCM10022277_29870 [Litoribacillus peritrichatus]|uniref:protein-tyrosine-phosphatase n=2 Tax=Litoribacillus peritrichatus TaxID=718191 RepID=A0ABP7MVS4_9GAMM